jgi:hypothetical protein
MHTLTSCGDEPSREYVFDELRREQPAKCELCKQDVAAYRWSQYGAGGEQQNLPVCRVCAGMIVLIGKNA